MTPRNCPVCGERLVIRFARHRQVHRSGVSVAAVRRYICSQCNIAVRIMRVPKSMFLTAALAKKQ